MTDTKSLIEALSSEAQKHILAVRNGATSVGILSTTHYEGEVAVRAVLAELDRQGWQCVPKRSTYEMDYAGSRAEFRGCTVWEVMISAAPKLMEG